VDELNRGVVFSYPQNHIMPKEALQFWPSIKKTHVDHCEGNGLKKKYRGGKKKKNLLSCSKETPVRREQPKGLGKKKRALGAARKRKKPPKGKRGGIAALPRSWAKKEEN